MNDISTLDQLFLTLERRRPTRDVILATKSESLAEATGLPSVGEPKCMKFFIQKVSDMSRGREWQRLSKSQLEISSRVPSIPEMYQCTILVPYTKQGMAHMHRLHSQSFSFVNRTMRVRAV